MAVATRGQHAVSSEASVPPAGQRRHSSVSHKITQFRCKFANRPMESLTLILAGSIMPPAEFEDDAALIFIRMTMSSGQYQSGKQWPLILIATARCTRVES